MPTVLIADDDPIMRQSLVAMLRGSAFVADVVADAMEAMQRLATRSYDVILSDIVMPEMDGIELLRAVRKHDLDVPVILLTGTPGLETAARAVEYGAFRYLIKPLDRSALLEVLDRAARMHALAKLKRAALELTGVDVGRLGDRAALECRFDLALGSMWMVFQPIVSVREKRVVAYEALLRNDEPTLRNPMLFLSAAAQLGRLSRVGRAVREQVAEQAHGAPEGCDLFVNLHPDDLADETLYAADDPLAAIAKRVVLEITERGTLDDVPDLAERAAALRARGYRLAIDDLGAGYAGLASLVQIYPEIVKLDMSIVRDLDREPKKRSIVASMAKLCTELGMRVVAEGVETKAERDALTEIGCDLLQGYFFARPDRGFPAVRFEDELAGR